MSDGRAERPGSAPSAGEGPSGHRREALDSVRLLPCAFPPGKVVEGTHHVTAEGTGPEPYGPRQGLVRGQGGFQDVQTCVVLPIHLPVAHKAGEVLAHPISAPCATRWAGLGRPGWVDLDDGDAGGERLVFDLAVEFAPRPRGEPTSHPRSSTAALG